MLWSVLADYIESDSEAPLATRHAKFLLEYAFDLASDERYLSEESRDGEDRKEIEHFRAEREWKTLCGKSIEHMSVNTFDRELDGVGFALLEAARAEVIAALGASVRRKGVAKKQVLAVARHYRVNPALIKEMAKNKAIRRALIDFIPRKPPDRIFDFEPIKMQYLSWRKSKRKRAKMRVTIEQVKQEKSFAAGYKIAIAMRDANMLFKEIADAQDARLFGTDENIVAELMRPCRTEHDFAYKLGAVRASLEVDSRPLKKLVRNRMEGKTIKLLERWVSESGWKELDMRVLKDVCEICSVTPPFHPASDRMVHICDKYREQYPPNYARLWVSMSKKLLKTLEGLLDFLNHQRTS